MKVSGSPIKKIGIVKNKGNRRKLIYYIRTIKQNFWLNIDNFNRIKNLLHIKIYIYDK